MTDAQTDGQTLDHGVYRTSIASRDKNSFYDDLLAIKGHRPLTYSWKRSKRETNIKAIRRTILGSIPDSTYGPVFAQFSYSATMEVGRSVVLGQLLLPHQQLSATFPITARSTVNKLFAAVFSALRSASSSASVTSASKEAGSRPLTDSRGATAADFFLGFLRRGCRSRTHQTVQAPVIHPRFHTAASSAADVRCRIFHIITWISGPRCAWTNPADN